MVLQAPHWVLGFVFLAVQVQSFTVPSSRVEDHRSLAKGDNCTCLPWKQAYERHGVVCGQGLEYYFVTKTGTAWPRANQMLGDEFCRRFFRRIPGSFCLNADQSDETGPLGGRQWCYVSPYCTDLRGGRRVPGADVSWKMCRSGDDLLRTRAPEDLDALRGSHSLALGLLAKFAYPIWQSDRWPAVERFFLGRQPPTGSERADLQQLVSSGRPMVFDSATGHPPFHVVMGESVYKIDFKPGGHRSYREGRMGEVTGLQCLKGCGGSTGL